MTPTRRLLQGLFFTAAAGMVDAVSFLALGGYYTAFMSGNTTQLGIALSRPSGAVAIPAAAIILFFAGSCLGTLVHIKAGDNGPKATSWFVAAVVAVSLVLFGCGPQLLAGLVLAVAMGAQNAILPMVGAARPGATFVTGSLFGAGQDLARAWTGAAPRWRWSQHLLIWLALLAGTGVGGLCYLNIGWLTLLGPLVLYGVAGLSLGQELPTNAGVNETSR
jgi:uncharacterized membrane protein YoaK (UPF0700 family)